MTIETEDVVAGLLSLAERCEKATGPDRNLEADMVRLSLPDTWEDEPVKQWDHVPGIGDSSGWFDAILAEAETRIHEARFIPRFTASLDAAMTLVPEGRDWVITKSSAQHYVLLGTDLPEPIETWSGKAETFPLALCAAALRARTQNTPDSEKDG